MVVYRLNTSCAAYTQAELTKTAPDMRLLLNSSSYFVLLIVQVGNCVISFYCCKLFAVRRCQLVMNGRW
jgi:hypothetical protein